MGAGASASNTPRNAAGAAAGVKYAAGSGAGAVGAAFEANPFDNSLGDDASSAQGKHPGGVLSERKLKKMALGMPGYKDVQRDYDETLSDMGKFNTIKTESWTKPDYDGTGPVRQEKLYVSVSLV